MWGHRLKSNAVVAAGILSGLQGVQAGDPVMPVCEVTLAWDANPEPDISGYRIYHGTGSGSHPNGVDAGNTTTAPLTLPGPGTYYAIVRAYNTAGLESLPSNEVSFTTPANLPPVVSLTDPVEGSTLEAPASITLTALAADSDGSITRVEFYDGSDVLGEVLAGIPFTFHWENVVPGTCSLMARAFDDDGAFTDSTSVNVTVIDETPPVIAGIPGDITVVPNPAGGTTALVSWAEPTATDNVGVVSLASTHDPGDTFPAGSTNVVYTATDAAGNIATAAFTVTVASIELWRQAMFGDMSNDPQIAGDAADPDGDEMSNLAEYLLGLDPFFADAELATSLSLSSDEVHFHFSHIPHLPDVALIIESSIPAGFEWLPQATLSPTGGWTLNSPDVEIATLPAGGLLGVTLTKPIHEGGEVFRLKMERLDMP